MNSKFQIEITGISGARVPVDISGPQTTIGRTAECDIWIEAFSESPVWGQWVIAGGFCHWIAEADGRDVRINGEICHRRQLSNGDEFSFPGGQKGLFRSFEFEPAQTEPQGVDPWALFKPADSPKPSAPTANGDSSGTPTDPEEKAASSTEIPSPLLETSIQELEIEEIFPADEPQDAAWGELILIKQEGSSTKLREAFCILDFGGSKASISYRHGQAFATAVSGTIFCSREKLGSKPRPLHDKELLAADGAVYMFRLLA